MSTLGYWIFARFFQRVRKAMEKESTPTRPRYMNRMSTPWDTRVRPVVIPVVRPTVPRADAASNAQSI